MRLSFCVCYLSLGVFARACAYSDMRKCGRFGGEGTGGALKNCFEFSASFLYANFLEFLIVGIRY
ncbi:MAG: hypothetical protein DBX55_06095 [Verrucomicrobia bacterium]|nr:MAG: hypothetical protein DBX55_06095 [Verrucomicrobiota bacterium]